MKYSELNLDNKLHLAYIVSQIFGTGFFLSEIYFKTVFSENKSMLAAALLFISALVESSSFLMKSQPSIWELCTFSVGTFLMWLFFILYLYGLTL